MAQITLTDSSNLIWDLSTEFSAKLLATSAVGDTRNILNSLLSSAVAGESYQLIFKQDVVGGRLIAFGNDYTVFGEINLEPNSITIISFVYDPDETIVIMTHGLESECVPFEVIIQGAIVYAIGKTNLTAFENNDTFRYYNNGNYYVGKVITSGAISLPTDIEDNTKISLNINN